jgi:hypothetical protein
MTHPYVRRAWTSLLLPLLAAAAAQPAGAQDRTLKVRLHGGIVQPVASTGDYFKFGPSAGVDVGYRLGERADLLLDLDMDWFNTTDVYPTPTTNLWRYRLGIEGDLTGDTGDNTFIVKVLAGAGATTIRSHKFWLVSRQPYTFDGENINQTSLTATGGLRLGMRTPDGLTWWLSTKLNWSPINDTNQDALKELARNKLDPLGSAMSLAITLGVTLW